MSDSKGQDEVAGARGIGDGRSPLDRALAFAVAICVVSVPGFFFAQMETARVQYLSEQWRGLVTARTVVAECATNPGDSCLGAVVKGIPSGAIPGTTAVFALTAGGTDEYGIATGAQTLAVDRDGAKLAMDSASSTRTGEMAGRVKNQIAEGGDNGLCDDSGDGGLVCVATSKDRATGGIIFKRDVQNGPWWITLAISLIFATIVFGLATWFPKRSRIQDLAVSAGTGIATGLTSAIALSFWTAGVVKANGDLEHLMGGMASVVGMNLMQTAVPIGIWFILVVSILTGIAVLALVGPVSRFMANLRGRPFIYASIAPAMVGMILLIFVPFFMGVYLAFLNNNGEFVELANFGEILFPSDVSDTNFYFTLGITVLWTALNVVLHVAIGLALALVLSDAKLRGKAIYRVLLIVPWAVPNYITALIWKWIFNTQYGPANALLALLGFGPVDWLGRSFFTNFMANLTTNTWLGFPFMMIVSLGALSSIPADLYEAAEMDGAGRWARFKHVTMPLLKPALFPAIILGTIWTFNMFNVVYLVSGGAPDNKTNILITEAYRSFRVLKNYGLAAAYSLIIFVILAVYTAVTNRLTKAAENVYE